MDTVAVVASTGNMLWLGMMRGVGVAAGISTWLTAAGAISMAAGWLRRKAGERTAD